MGVGRAEQQSQERRVRLGELGLDPEGGPAQGEAAREARSGLWPTSRSCRFPQDIFVSSSQDSWRLRTGFFRKVLL